MPLTNPYSVPGVVTHEVTAGNTFTGVAPNGILDTIGIDAPYFGGRVNIFGQCTAAGLYGPSPAAQGLTIQSIRFNGAGTTQVTVAIRQNLYPTAAPVSFDYLILDTDKIGPTDNIGGAASQADPADFVYSFREPHLLLPNTSVVVVSAGALAADGRCTLNVRSRLGCPPLCSD